MSSSKQELRAYLQRETKAYFEHIGLSTDQSISYYQIDTLSLIEANECQISVQSTVGHAREQFVKIEALIRHYYTQNFPNLRAVLGTFKTAKLIEDAFINSQNITLKTYVQPYHNVLIIPVFAALNRIGIFAIDITAYFSQCEESVSKQMQIGKILAYAQDCHLKICQLQNELASNRIKLTDRERQILFWVVRGKSNAVIADIIGISLHTVNGYLRNIYLKTETSDRTSAAIKAVHHGLLHKQIGTNTGRYDNMNIHDRELCAI